MQTKQLLVIPHTLFSRLPTPAPTPRPLHQQPSASRHPIIYTLTFQMSKPSQSSTLTTSATQLIQRRLHKSSLRLLSFKTPHTSISPSYVLSFPSFSKLSPRCLQLTNGSSQRSPAMGALPADEMEKVLHNPIKCGSDSETGNVRRSVTITATQKFQGIIVHLSTSGPFNYYVTLPGEEGGGRLSVTLCDRGGSAER